jgi:hypothetical protein
MTSGGYGAALFLLAAFAWFGPADGAEATDVRSRQSAGDRLPMSTKCTVKCDELEKTCEEHERLHPSCSVVNICLEEKLQCEAQCRPRATLNGRVRS